MRRLPLTGAACVLAILVHRSLLATMLVGGDPPLLCPPRSEDVRVEIREDSARVAATGAFSLPATFHGSLTLLCALPRQEGIQSVRVTLDGKPVKTAILRQNDSVKLVQRLLSATGNAGLLRYLDSPILHAEVTLPKGVSQAAFALELVVPVERAANTRGFSFPLDTPWLCCGQPSPARLSVDVETETAIGVVWSPSHLASVLRPGPLRAVVSIPSDSPRFASEFRLLYTGGEPGPPIPHCLVTSDGTTGYGFFALVVCAPVRNGRLGNSGLTVALDTSASMKNDKLSCARAVAAGLLDRLEETARFNVVVFGAEVKRLFPSPASAQKDAIETAKRPVASMVVGGPTNLFDALAAALQDSQRQGNPHSIVVVSDGSANLAGGPVAVLKAVTALNRNRSRIFTIAVGEDAHHAFLDNLARSTGGRCVRVASPGAPGAGEAAASSVLSLMSPPVLADLRVTSGGTPVEDLIRLGEPDLAGGTEVEILGRWKGNEPPAFKIAGLLDGNPEQVTLGGENASSVCPDAPVVERWAFHRSKELCAEVARRNEAEPAIVSLADFALGHGIVTSYTFPLALPASGQFGARELEQIRQDKRFADRAEIPWREQDAAVSRLRQRGLLYVGSGMRTTSSLLDEAANVPPAASTKAKLELEKQAANPLAEEAPGKEELSPDSPKTEPDVRFAQIVKEIRFRKERGRFADTVVKHVGGRVFYQFGEEWVDSALSAEADEVGVVFASDAFFELFDRSPVCRQAFPAGSRLILMLKADLAVRVGQDGLKTLSDADRQRLFQ